MSQGNKNKRKKYYQSGNNHGKKSCNDGGLMQPGMVGFLVTCNHREQESLRETYNIVNELLDNIQNGSGTSKKQEDESLESAIAREVSQLKQDYSKNRLKQVSTKCKNILFVQMGWHTESGSVQNESNESVESEEQYQPVLSPVELICSLFDGIKQSGGKQPARFIQRIVPIETTCKANIEAIEECVRSLLAVTSPANGQVGTPANGQVGTQKDGDEAKVPEESIKSENCPLSSLTKATYQIDCKVRNNSDLTRSDIIESIAHVVKTHRPNWSVNFDAPLITLSISILNRKACISFLPNYFEYKKYNLIEYSNKIKNEIKSANETVTDMPKDEDGDRTKDNEQVTKDNEQVTNEEKRMEEIVESVKEDN